MIERHCKFTVLLKSFLFFLVQIEQDKETSPSRMYFTNQNGEHFEHTKRGEEHVHLINYIQ